MEKYVGDWTNDTSEVQLCQCSRCESKFNGTRGRTICLICNTAMNVAEDTRRILQKNDEAYNAIRAMERDMNASVIGYDVEEYMFSLERRAMKDRGKLK